MEEAEHLYQESLSLFRSGDLKQAITKLEEATRFAPSFGDALEALGVLYEKVDRLDDAIEIMKRLTRVSPNHIMARTNLSRFYAQKGMILEAEKEQAEARRLSWKAELRAQKAQDHSQKMTPEEEVKEAEKEAENKIARYKKVIELDPKDVLGYFSLGTAYLDGRRLEEARNTFEQAIHIDSNHSPSYFNLGVVLESLGRKDEAIQIYEKGTRVADSRGDMIPLKKMEARLRVLKQTS